MDESFFMDAMSIVGLPFIVIDEDSFDDDEPSDEFRNTPPWEEDDV